MRRIFATTLRIFNSKVIVLNVNNELSTFWTKNEYFSHVVHGIIMQTRNKQYFAWVSNFDQNA